MSNQSNYAHEKFGGDIEGSFKKKDKGIMLFIMAANVTSIFTQMYIAKMTSKHSFFPNFLHTVPLTSLSPSFSHYGHFHGCFHLQLSEAQCTVGLLPFFFLMKIQPSIPLQSQVESHTSFWFVLLNSCNTKCRHSLSWCS